MRNRDYSPRELDSILSNNRRSVLANRRAIVAGLTEDTVSEVENLTQNLHDFYANIARTLLDLSEQIPDDKTYFQTAKKEIWYPIQQMYEQHRGQSDSIEGVIRTFLYNIQTNIDMMINEILNERRYGDKRILVDDVLR